MKKILALVMVLGIVSLSIASLSFKINETVYSSGSTVAISETTTIGLYNNIEFPGVPDIMWISIDPGSEVENSGVTYDEGVVLPGTWTITDYGLSEGLWWWYIFNPVLGVGRTKIGTMFEVDVDGPGTLAVYDTSYYVIEIGHINLIPEPCTLLLLGLGGLLIRKR